MKKKLSLLMVALVAIAAFAVQASRRAVAELTVISEATVWDFSQDVTLADTHDGDLAYEGEAQQVENIYANIADLQFAESFKADALAFTGQYPFRSNKKKMAQNGTLHFKTSVPGKIVVKFSDTGSGASATAVKRYLVVNGEQTEYWASRENNSTEEGKAYAEQLNVTTDEIAVPAGDVTISGSAALVYTYVSFTPLVPEDIVVEPAEGDIAAAVATASEGKLVKNITINLAKDGAYTIKSPITANAGLIINGNGATINASDLKGNFVQMNKEPQIEAVESGQFVIKAPMTIDGVKVKGLTKALFADNGKSYAYETFTINNCVIENTTQGNVVLNMSSSMAINFNITNTTFYSKEAGTANFIAMSGKRPWQITGYEEETGKMTVANCTFYNVAKNKQFMNTNTLKGQKYLYVFNSNIFVNVSNKKIYGNMTNNKNQLTTDGKNTYLWDGTFFSETNYNGDEGLQTDPYFKDAANGDFSLDVASAQTENKTGDPRWTAYLPYNISVAEGLTNGEIKVQAKAGAGVTVTVSGTPAEGYMMDKIAVKTVPEGELAPEDVAVKGFTFVMPEANVVVSATFETKPVDITVDAAEGELAAQVEAAKKPVIDAGNRVGNITINLTAEKTYTIANAINATGSVIINGNGATIDASALAEPFIHVAEQPTIGLNANGFYEIANININKVNITGLKNQLFYANKMNILVKKLNVEDAVVAIAGATKKSVFDFNGGGGFEEILVNNSTIWADDATEWQNGGFYSTQQGKKMAELGTTKYNITITNSTIYNISKGKTTSSTRENSQTGMLFTVKNNVIVNCGKSGQFVKGLNNGQAGKDENWDVDGNIFNFSGANVAEAQIGTTAENIKNTIAGDIVFTDAAAGDFNATLLKAEEPAVENLSILVGDPRWKVDVKKDTYTKSINIEQLVLDNGVTYDIATALAEKNIEAVNINALDSLNDDKGMLRNEAFLGLKLKTEGAYIKVKVMKGKALNVKFGQIADPIKVTINGVDQETQIAAQKDGSSTIFELPAAEADQEVIFTTTANGTVVLKQIMIGEAIAEVKLPAQVKFEATIAAAENGTVALAAETLTNTKAPFMIKAGDVVTITATPAEGFELDAITVMNGETPVEVVDGKFTMPAAAVTVSATFKQASGIEGIAADKLNGTIFNLKGQRVEKTQKGLFIINGKKVVKK